MLAVATIAAGLTSNFESHAETSIVLQSDRVIESSGLAVSRRDPECFWTHNDSGDTAVLYAFDRQGNLTGTATLDGVTAIDWEDMASFRDGASDRLLVADVGDNLRKRDFISLYFFDEPDPHANERVSEFTRVDVRYADGAKDCEAVAVDGRRRQVWLVGKSFLPLATCDTIPLPAVNAAPEIEVTATRVGAIPVPLVSAMDIEPRSGEIVVVNYFQCFRFDNTAQADAGAWMSSVARMNELPRLRQIEAIAFDDAGQLWLTSEGSPAILQRFDTAVRPPSSPNGLPSQ